MRGVAIVIGPIGFPNTQDPYAAASRSSHPAVSIRRFAPSPFEDRRLTGRHPRPHVQVRGPQKPVGRTTFAGTVDRGRPFPSNFAAGPSGGSLSYPTMLIESDGLREPFPSLLGTYISPANARNARVRGFLYSICDSLAKPVARRVLSHSVPTALFPPSSLSCVLFAWIVDPARLYLFLQQCWITLLFLFGSLTAECVGSLLSVRREQHCWKHSRGRTRHIDS